MTLRECMWIAFITLIFVGGSVWLIAEVVQAAQHIAHQPECTIVYDASSAPKECE